MELILIRHGKAEDNPEIIDDNLRKLTPDGKKRLHKTLPSLGLLIRSLDEAQIWTSTLTRAVQTGEIVAKMFGNLDVQQHEFIGSGDYDLLTAALAGVRPSATVIIVGHLPHLSDWSRQLCGVALPFKKGAAACIHMDFSDPAGNELLWFFQPQSLARLGETLLKNSCHRS
jgi:phosphohistidine phosphatase